MTKEGLFGDKKVYYSGSINGSPEIEPDFAWKLVQYMRENGAVVLSEHVAGRNQQEKDILRAQNIGMDIQEMLQDKEPWWAIREQDIKWVEEATHFVAVINAPSHGVGIEIEHAILKPRLGLNETPILCLVHEDLKNKISFMIKGVGENEAQQFYINEYIDLDSAKSEIFKFLTK